jgi:hypothetical protein
MSGDIVEKTLARIEAALMRIERAETRASAASRALEVRHAQLRRAVTQSLEDLDHVIAGTEP